MKKSYKKGIATVLSVLIMITSINTNAFADAVLPNDILLTEESDNNAVEEDVSSKYTIFFDEKDVSVNVGESKNLKYSVTADDGTEVNISDVELKWTSKDKKIATVKNGVVKGVAGGKTEIIAKIEGESKEVRCFVKVAEKEVIQSNAETEVADLEEKTEIEKPEIVFEKDSLELTVNESEEISFSLTPMDLNLDATELEWTTDDPTVAIVEDGVVTARGEGSTTIEVFSDNLDNSVSADIMVTVFGIQSDAGEESADLEENIEVEKLEVVFDKDNLDLAVGEREQLSFAMLPEGLELETLELEWKTEDASVATVENGIVTAVGVGSTTVEVFSTGTDHSMNAKVLITVLENEMKTGEIPIYTAEDLYNVRNNLTGSYILMNDIDLSQYENWEPIGSGHYTEDAFSGTFDGNGFTISNMKITEPQDSGFLNCGLFGVVYDARFENIILKDIDIDINDSIGGRAVMAGGIAGDIMSGGGWANNVATTFTNCSVSGNISVVAKHSAVVGGIVGRSYAYTNVATLKQCSNTADISIKVPTPQSNGGATVGGIAGEGGGIFQCFNSGNVTVKASTNVEYPITEFLCVGGILGGFSSGYTQSLRKYTIEDCYNTGDIYAEVLKSHHVSNVNVGGILGLFGSSSNNHDFHMYNCYNTGSVKIVAKENNLSFASGIVGNISSKSVAPLAIKGCVVLSDNILTTTSSSSSVIACDTGNKGLISNCYARDDIGGSEINEDAILQDLQEFKKEDFYTNIEWDFSDIWIMPKNGGYPQLRAFDYGSLPDDELPTSIELEAASCSLEQGMTGKINATVLPETATNKKLVWSRAFLKTRMIYTI